MPALQAFECGFTPWGDAYSPALVSEVESALERQLSRQFMKAGKDPKMRRLRQDQRFTTQGEESRELFVLLDGVLRVDVDGVVLAEIAPGAVFGERAILESGQRTATLSAVTPCTVAVADHSAIDPESLQRLVSGHRREDDT
ncbi:hypothetical protein BH18ACT9_BH18ACT9_12540 [soil metagenome]